MSTFIMTLAQPALLAWLLKATALLMLALGLTSILRRAAAGTRHLVWLATLAGILLLPPVSLWTPLRLAIVPAELMPSLPRVTPVEQTTIVVPRTAVAEPTFTAPVATTPANGTPSEPALSTPAEALPNEPVFPFWTTILSLWGAVAFGLLGWLGFGALSVRRIVRSGRVLDERAWTAPLCEIADRLDLDFVPRLLSSPLIEMPFACGIVQPTVVLPASAEQWSDNRRRAVLFHELAHVKRRDLVGHTLGRLACALYWFHPLVWTAARRLRAESERACDDLVLSCGARASDYADHLLDIVVSVRHHGAPATAMPMARRRELEGRVLAILDPAVARIAPGRMKTATVLAGLGALALSVAAMAPARTPEPVLTTVERDTAQAKMAETRSPVSKPNEPARRVAPATPAPDANPAAAPAPSAPNPSPAPSPQSVTTTTTATNEVSSFTAAIGKLTKVAVREAAAALTAGVEPERKSQSKSETAKAGVDTAKVALLLKVLRNDPDASVRKMAAWGLNDAGDVLGALDALAEAVRSDEDAEVREMAAWALADARRESVRRVLANALRRDPSDEVRETAAWALGNGGVRDVDRDALELALTSDESAEVRESAAWALGVSPRRPASRALVAALGDKSAEVRETAAWALAEIEDDEAAPAVEAAFARETNAEVRMAELRALTFMHVENRSILDAALSSKDPELRARAVRMLAGSPGAWPEPRPRPRPRPMP